MASRPHDSANNKESDRAEEEPGCLASCLNCILHPVLYATFYPEDDFHTKVRKACIALSLFWSCTGGLLVVIMCATAIAASPRNALTWIWALLMGGCTVLGIPVYIRFRSTRIATDTLCTIVTWGWQVSLFLSVIILPGPYGPLFSVCNAVVSIACDISSKRAATIVSGLMALYCVINDALDCKISLASANCGRGTPSSLSGAITATWTVVVCCVMMFAQQYYSAYAYDECVENVKKGAARAQLASDTAGQLASFVSGYDVDAMDRALDSYEQVPACDRDLLESFRSISANLKLYRPHLPNYLLSATGASADDEEEAAPAIKVDTTDSARGGGGVPHRRGSVADVPASGRPQPPASARSSYSQAESSSCAQRVPAVNGASHLPPFRGKVTLGMVHLCIGEPPRLESSTVLLRASVNPAPPLLTPSSSTYSQPQPHSNSHLSGYYPPRGAAETREALCNRLVAKVQELAASTHASIHSFIGDTLVVSWNGTRRVVQGETKACRFAVGVRDAVADVSRTSTIPIECAVGIATGQAACMFAGDDHQRTFTLGGPYVVQRAQAALADARDCARYLAPNEGGAVLIDRPSSNVARFNFAIRGVALLDDRLVECSTVGGDDVNATDSPGSKRLLTDGEQSPRRATEGGASFDSVAARAVSDRMLFEVVHERASSANEWMYELEATESRSYEAVTRATTLLGLELRSEAQEALAAALSALSQPSGDSTTAAFAAAHTITAAVSRLSMTIQLATKSSA